MKRRSGILLHITSLPGRFGIGDLGPEAINFLHFLKQTKTSIWQILPIHPTGYGNSPYTAFSAFAGNELLISPEVLIDEKFLPFESIESYPNLSGSFVDYNQVIQLKTALFQKAFDHYKENQDTSIVSFESLSVGKESEFIHRTIREDFTFFCGLEFIKPWLLNYALFRVLKEKNEQKNWNHWESGEKNRDPEVLRKIIDSYKDRIEYYKFLQYVFFRQWFRVKKVAQELGILIFGDIPIFVSYDSADVWTHKHIFQLYPNGNPKVVAGVPPDYFSETGQLWGNPLYNWNQLKKEDYDWWKLRLINLGKLVDWLRIDHFRAFAAAWEIPGRATTAMKGVWKKGPGAHFFQAIRKEPELSSRVIIAEDLGILGPDVEKLRDQFAFPGMKILHFAFGGGNDNLYLPHNHIQNCVVYTGTHDNDTTVGWYSQSPYHIQEHVRNYFGIDANRIALKMIRYAMLSVADTAIFPMQDLMELDSSYRMNRPSIAQGNWEWRMEWPKLSDENCIYLTQLNEISDRAYA